MYDVFKINNTDGSSIVVSQHGGQLLSWRDANKNEAFYLSKKAKVDINNPIRGGVPICFPQFSNFGNILKHGFARDFLWNVDFIAEGSNPKILLSLIHNEQSLKIFPYKFKLSLGIKFNASTLSINLSVQNCDKNPFEFNCGLHPYFLCNLDNAFVLGLKNSQYSYNNKAGIINNSSFKVASEVDYIFKNLTKVVSLTSNNTMLSIHKNNFKDFIMWNPYKDLPDMETDDYKKFICLEPVAIDKILLKPNNFWFASSSFIRRQSK